MKVPQFIRFPFLRKKNYFIRVLKYLYYNSGDRFQADLLLKKLKLKNYAYFLNCLEWLVDDGLVVREQSQIINSEPPFNTYDVALYRISHDGYKFIMELKSTQNNLWVSILAIIISAISVINVISNNAKTTSKIIDLENQIQKIEHKYVTNKNSDDSQDIIDSLFLIFNKTVKEDSINNLNQNQ
ncbi:hypothetical protein [Marivirga arenosa]|uniref:Uncharacterized protein n=1 Tax=Marivirga arenosa TaxID=3059076 RepID=A0AA51ZX12_9BACT|nr:hypothetical protein [Marivirga sp. BKB1-2]WNB18319.1 hypothetical protein QYS47_29890 [Marivirga sp. BKB1-2]